MTNSYFGISYGNVSNIDINNEKQMSDMMVGYMMNKTRRIFTYSGLPDNIPERILELNLQLGGHICITEYKGELYSLVGQFGGVPNYNYMPTVYTVANPYLNYNANLKIGEDCIVIPSDSMYIGLYPLIKKYCDLIAKSETTLKLNNIMHRMPYSIICPDDDTKNSAEILLNNIEKGKLGVLLDESLFKNMNSFPMVDGTRTTELIEYTQYLRGTLYNELGLPSATNMKRESLNDDETHLNDKILLPLIDDMLECRKEALTKVNEKYNTNISVELNTAWRDISEESEVYNDGSDTETIEDGTTGFEHGNS